MISVIAKKVFHTSLYLGVFLVTVLVVTAFAQSGMERFVYYYPVSAKMANSIEIEPDSDLEFRFNQPVVMFSAENITIEPRINFSYELSNERKTLKIKSEVPLISGTKYKLLLQKIRGLSGLVLEEAGFVFYTSQEKVSANQVGVAKDPVHYAVFELSKDRYMPPEASRPKIEIEVEPKFKEGKYMDVSVDHQIMTLFENGIKINSFLVSSGIPGLSTPMGTYNIQRKELNHWSGYGLWMPFSLNFSGPYYIHELPYWPSGFREGESHLGHKASHGCIRLGIGPAKYVYEWAEIGTPLYIHK